MLALWIGLALAADPAKLDAMAQQAFNMADVDPTKAAKLANKVLKADPDHPTALFVRAIELLRMAGIAETAEARDQVLGLAKEDLRKVTQLAPDTIMGRIARDALVAMEVPEAHRSPPEPACSNEAVAAYDRAEAAWARRDWEAARAGYDEALKLCPDNATWWTYAGDAWPDQPDVALTYYERALQVDPCHWQAYRFHADVLFGQGRSSEGFDDLVDAVACHPRYEAAWGTAAQMALGWGGKAPLAAAPVLPTSAEAAAATGPEWGAWWAAREGHTGTPLERSVAAVRAGVAVPSLDPTWQIASASVAAGDPESAVLLLFYEPDLEDYLVARNTTSHDALVAWLRRYAFVVPGEAPR